MSHVILQTQKVVLHLCGREREGREGEEEGRKEREGRTERGRESRMVEAGEKRGREKRKLVGV